MMEKKRSKGVTKFGVFAILYGLFTSWMGSGDSHIPILIPMLIGIGLVTSGIFIFKLMNWARILFMLGMGMNSICVGLQLLLDPQISSTYKGIDLFEVFLVGF